MRRSMRRFNRPANAFSEKFEDDCHVTSSALKSKFQTETLPEFHRQPGYIAGVVRLRARQQRAARKPKHLKRGGACAKGTRLLSAAEAARTLACETLGGRSRLPSDIVRAGGCSGFRSARGGSSVAFFKAGRHFDSGQVFPMLGLSKQFPAIVRIIRRVLAAQRRRGAVANDIFHGCLV
jgi:hypothetical protein